MADKKKNKKTAAPSGCDITRNGSKFTLSWKIKAKDTKDGQKRRYAINGKKHSAEKIKAKATKTSITTNAYPLKTVTIEVQDNQKEDKKKASNWAGDTFKFKRPPKSVSAMSLSSDYWNVCNVSYGYKGSFKFTNNDHYGYIQTERQTTFYKQGTDTKNIKWTKNDGNKGYDILKGATGSFTKREDSLTLSKDTAYVRRYRFRIKCKRGYRTKKANNAWMAVCSHYYSIPYTPTVKKATISSDDSGGMDCVVRWYSPDDTFHPIDYTVLQYGIGVPGIDMSCPQDISWTDRPSMKDTKTTANKNKKGKVVSYNKNEDGDRFYIDTVIDPDYCLFVRVKNTHDNNSSYSKPKRATGIITSLTAPSIVSVNPDYTTNRVSIVVNNNSAVPDSSVAVIFKSILDSESEEEIIGVLPHGVSEITIQCPDLETFDEFSFGVFAFVGDSGNYVLTDDTTVNAKKTYYTRTGSDEDIATVIDSPTGNPQEKGYYEKYDEGGYYLSEDTSVNPNTTYYNVIPATPFVYTKVSNPSGNPHSKNYFEFVPNISSDVSYTKSGETFTYSKYEIPNITMRSPTIWQDGDIPRAPTNVEANLVPNQENMALVTWNWAWKSADIAELSWSDNENAWESTDQPEMYRIPNTHAGKWYIHGLESGVTWYIKVRLIKTTEDGENVGPWGSANPLDMSSAPNRPVLECSKEAVAMGDSFTLSWDYISTDGTDQQGAMLRNVTRAQDGTIVIGEDLNKEITTERTIDLTPEELEWSMGEEHGFIICVTSDSGKTSEWSDPPVWISVADPITCTVNSTTFKERPLYTLTDDTEIDEAQTYYTLTATEVSEPDVNNLSTYYELVSGIYVLTDDGVIDEESTYYTVVGTEVTLPQVEELGSYYIRSVLNILDKLPLVISAEMAGGSDTGRYANVTIERATSYFVDRPDESVYQGYEGEIVYSGDFEDVSNIEIKQTDLQGYLDDTASYFLSISCFDSLGQTYSIDPILFTVNWEHQAAVPTAAAILDQIYSVMKITPSIDPEKYREGDTFDIYRLSIDKPVLIVKGGSYRANPVENPTGNPHEQRYCEKDGDSYHISEDTEVDSEKTYYIVGVGDTYIDPYPTIGPYGGHRVVTVTANGDFISNDEESDMAWVDLDEEDGDIFYSDFSIINYSEGTFNILYNADLSTNWNKDFRETRYLGGHIQGDWNAGVSRSSTINSVMLREDNFLSIRDFRRLAEYTGICHIRTLDGSNYYADIQVSETIPYDDNPLNSYSFKVTRVDNDGYDGIELSEWNKIIGE